MKGKSGVQMQVSQCMIDFKKKVKNDRIKIGKESNGDLSDKRLSITFVKLLSMPETYNILVNCDIDLRREE